MNVMTLLIGPDPEARPADPVHGVADAPAGLPRTEIGCVRSSSEEPS